LFYLRSFSFLSCIFRRMPSKIASFVPARIYNLNQLI